jgi:glycosyltransferase involved in cell wall biosynthesis
MWGVFVREYARAASLSNDVIVLHLIENDTQVKNAWLIESESNPELTSRIDTYRIRIGSRPPSPIRYLNSIAGAIQAFRHVHSQGFQPDLIHVHTYRPAIPAIILGRFYHIPVIVSEHNSAWMRHLLSTHHIFIARIAFQNAALVIPVSQALQNAIMTYHIKARFHIIPNVVDTSLFRPPHAVKNSEEKRILFAGSLVPVKGLHHLLNSVAILPKKCKWKLDIVGEGPERASYEALSNELGLSDQVTFHGQLSKSSLAEFMRQSDLFVLPSHTETFSVATAEALATGLPVLATRCGGPEEYINDQVGRLVPVGDLQALSKAISDMLNNLDQYKRNNIADYADERFSLTVIGNQLDAIYRQFTSQA